MVQQVRLHSRVDRKGLCRREAGGCRTRAWPNHDDNVIIPKLLLHPKRFVAPNVAGPRDDSPLDCRGAEAARRAGQRWAGTIAGSNTGCVTCHRLLRPEAYYPITNF